MIELQIMWEKNAKRDLQVELVKTTALITGAIFFLCVLRCVRACRSNNTLDSTSPLDDQQDATTTKVKLTTRPSYPARLGPPRHIINAQAQVPIDFNHLRSQGWRLF
jgi:hypothetical protein